MIEKYKTSDFFSRVEIFVLIGIISFSVFLRLILYKPHVPFWDGAVYILMGKYFFSSGQMGLLEAVRPFGWPYILGFLGNLGFSPILAGNFISFLTHSGCIYLTYRIGRRVGAATEGLIAAFLLSLSPIYLFWGNTGYPDIAASFLGLWMVYLFLKRAGLWAGFVGAASFFVKFTQIIPMTVLTIFSVLRAGSNERTAKFYFLFGLVLIGLPLLIIQGTLYHDIFAFYKDGKAVYGQLSFSWAGEFFSCLQVLLRVESWLLVLVPWGLITLIRRGAVDEGKVIIGVTGLLSFLWVPQLAIPEHVPRYLILSLPYLYLIVAMAWKDLLHRSLINKPFLLLLIVFTFGVLGYQTVKFSKKNFSEYKLSPIQKYVLKHEADIKGTIWISDPRMIVFSELKAEELMYYPVFDLKRINDLSEKITSVDYIFLDSRALVCRPQNDSACEQAKKEFIHLIATRFQAEYLEKDSNGMIVGGIFRPIEPDSGPTRP